MNNRCYKRIIVMNMVRMNRTKRRRIQSKDAFLDSANKNQFVILMY